MRENAASVNIKSNKSKKTKLGRIFFKNSSETNLNEFGKNERNGRSQRAVLLDSKEELRTRSVALERDGIKDKHRIKAETFYQTMKRPRKNPLSRSYKKNEELNAKDLLNVTCDSLFSDKSFINEQRPNSTNGLYDDTFNEYDCSESSEINESFYRENSVSYHHEELLKPLETKITSSSSDICTLSLESLKSSNQNNWETPPKRRKVKLNSDYPMDKNETSPRTQQFSPLSIIQSKQKSDIHSNQCVGRSMSERFPGVVLRKNNHAALPEVRDGSKRLSLQDQPKSARSKKVHRSTTLYWENKSDAHDNVEDLVLNVSKSARIQSCFNDTILHSAAINGQLDIIKFYVDKDKYLNEQNGYLNTALHCATHHKHNDIIDVLLEYNADVNLQNIEGDTPLHLACDQELINVVKKLILKGANINIQNENGETPLHTSVRRNKFEIVRYLIDHGADLAIQNLQGNTPIHSALHYFAASDVIILLIENIEKHSGKKRRNRHTRNISEASDSDNFITSDDLIDSGTETDYEGQSTVDYDEDSEPNVAQREYTDKTDGNIQTKITQRRLSLNHIQSSHDYNEFTTGMAGCSEMSESNELSLKTGINGTLKQPSENIKYLTEKITLDSEEIVNMTNLSGDTLLLRAVKYCSCDVVEMILNCSNINLSAINKKGNSVLHCASILPTADSLNLLLHRGGTQLLNVKNGLGNTPLHSATERGKVETVCCLLKHGASSDVQNNAGNTPSHCAVLTNQSQCLRVLLQHHADVRKFNKNGQIPLHCAVENGNLEILKFLLEDHDKQNNKLFIKTKTGDSLLHIAIKGDHLEEEKIQLLQCLLNASIDINNIDNNGNTILHLVLNTNQDKIIKFLLSHYDIDCNLRNNEGNTALHLIAEHNLISIVSMIKASSMDLSLKNKNELTPLNIALQKCHSDMAMILLNTAWDLDFKL